MSRDRISRLDAYRDRLRARVGPPEPEVPAPGSISARVRRLTNGGTLRDEENRVKALHDPELRRRSKALLKSLCPNPRMERR